MKLKKYYIFNVYIMFKIGAETFAKNLVDTIEVNKTDIQSVFSINMIYMQKTLDIKKH